MREHGFWDYTTPGAGGMEWYGADEYRRLLDDMAGAGMNSLLVMVKWFTTGYRSRLPFLDQAADNPVIASDNELLRQTIREAHARGILVRLGAVGTAYETRWVDAPPLWTHESLSGYTFEHPIGYYDGDAPGLQERCVEMCAEIVELFPEADGLMVELEFSGVEAPHRIPLYNAWAAEHGYPSFEQLGHPINPRGLDVPGWRDYTTARRLDWLREIERAVRARGFAGSLCTIAETGRTEFTLAQEMNLAMLRERCPDWFAITYEYDKWLYRYGMMDLNVTTPQSYGLPTWYLARGVMTWGWPGWPLPLSLPQSWAMDVEDVRQFHPDGLWWFGTGAVGEGTHVAESRLAQSGFPDGRAARKALLEQAAALRGMMG